MKIKLSVLLGESLLFSILSFSMLAILWYPWLFSPSFVGADNAVQALASYAQVVLAVTLAVVSAVVAISSTEQRTLEHHKFQAAPAYSEKSLKIWWDKRSQSALDNLTLHLHKSQHCLEQGSVEQEISKERFEFPNDRQRAAEGFRDSWYWAREVTFTLWLKDVDTRKNLQELSSAFKEKAGIFRVLWHHYSAESSQKELDQVVGRLPRFVAMALVQSFICLQGDPLFASFVGSILHTSVDTTVPASTVPLGVFLGFLFIAFASFVVMSWQLVAPLIRIVRKPKTPLLDFGENDAHDRKNASA